MSDATKAEDLRNKSEDELAEFIKEKEEELLKLRFQHYTGQLENSARLKVARRELARAKTVVVEKRSAS